MNCYKIKNIVEVLLEILNALRNLESKYCTWFTIEQVANYIGLSTNTVYQYVSKRKIPFYKIPNSSKLIFKREEIDKWIEGDGYQRIDEDKAEEKAGMIWERTKMGKIKSRS